MLPNLSKLKLDTVHNSPLPPIGTGGTDGSNEFNPYKYHSNDPDEHGERSYEASLRFRKEEAMRRQNKARTTLLETVRTRNSGPRTEGLDTLGERPKVERLDSSISNDRRVFSVMAYTRGWDSLINLVKTKSTRPYEGLSYMYENKTSISGRLKAYFAFFIDFSSDESNVFLQYLQSEHPTGSDDLAGWYDASDPDDARMRQLPVFDPKMTSDESFRFVITDPAAFCSDAKSDDLEMSVVIPKKFALVKERSDLDSSPVTSSPSERDRTLLELMTQWRLKDLWEDLLETSQPPSPRVHLARQVFDHCVYQMMETLESCFYPFYKWVWTPCFDNESLEEDANGTNVRYRGQTAAKNGSVIVPERFNSTAASRAPAMEFTNRKQDDALHILVIHKNVQVLDIHTFLGSEQNPDLVCFKDECELLIKPNMKYEQMTEEKALLLYGEYTSEPQYKISRDAEDAFTRNEDGSDGPPMKKFYWRVTDPALPNSYF